jgi:ribosomal protein S15P/S13E
LQQKVNEIGAKDDIKNLEKLLDELNDHIEEKHKDG